MRARTARGVALLVPLAAMAAMATLAPPFDPAASGDGEVSEVPVEVTDGTTRTAAPPAPGDVPEAVLGSLTADDLPEGCTTPNRAMTLHAVELDRVDGEPRLGYGLTAETASYPGPTIEMVEGDCLAITLVNDIPEATLAELRDHPELGGGNHDLPLGVSIHPHGVKYTASSDGTLHTGSWVAPGQARTYVWYAEPRSIGLDGRVLSHGSAGYWWYHDHLVGTAHGTGGVGSGLFAALIVRRAGDPLPDHTFVMAMGDDATINLRNHPDTDTCDDTGKTSITCFGAAPGERVEFAVFGIGNDFHTFHLHGHTWVPNRTGVLAPTDVASSIVDVVTVGPSYSFGFQVVAGASVGEGDWMLHCHVQRHSDQGMATFLHVDERFRAPA